MTPLAAAIDLGSTLIKSAIVDDEGRLSARTVAAAPPLAGEGGIREGDAAAYACAAERVLADLAAELPPGTALGLASQRSSFLLWDRASGAPLTPLVSWQDRRAAAWCARHGADGAEIARRTGLVLSAHYIGPKLAASSIEWGDLLRRETTRLGTLDCWLVWRRTGGRVHEVDVTMAARSAMLDLATGDWSEGLLALYGVPRAILPRVRATTDVAAALDGGLVLRATIADQPAALLPLVAAGADTLVVTLGTGGFVVRPLVDRDVPPPGYLLAPLLARPDGPTLFGHEGTVNGAGAAVDRCGGGPTALPIADPAPAALCLPDVAGLGSPYWRAEIGLTFTPAAERLDAADRRRIVLEGLLFRLRQVIDDLGGAPAPRRVLVVGGLARDPFVAGGLAALLGRPVECPEIVDAGLLGAARLAAGLPAHAAPPARVVDPGSGGAYLASKYPRWRAWVETLL